MGFFCFDLYIRYLLFRKLSASIKTALGSFIIYTYILLLKSIKGLFANVLVGIACVFLLLVIKPP